MVCRVKMGRILDDWVSFDTEPSYQGWYAIQFSDGESDEWYDVLFWSDPNEKWGGHITTRAGLRSIKGFVYRDQALAFLGATDC